VLLGFGAFLQPKGCAPMASLVPRARWYCREGFSDLADAEGGRISSVVSQAQHRPCPASAAGRLARRPDSVHSTEPQGCADQGQLSILWNPAPAKRASEGELPSVMMLRSSE